MIILLTLENCIKYVFPFIVTFNAKQFEYYLKGKKMIANNNLEQMKSEISRRGK